MNIATPLLIKIYDTKYGLMGYLAIDSFINNVTMGGIRIKTEGGIINGFHSREAMFLAREMSLKLGFHLIPIGGSKTVVHLPLGLTQKERDDYFYSLGKSLGPFLRKGILRTGQDMGMTERDLYFVMLGTGKNGKSIPDSKAKSSSGHFTALGIVTTLETILKSYKIKNDTLSCCIEGFGSVGSHLGQFLDDKGIKIKGISTKTGALFNANGLNIDKLLSLHSQHKDNLVHYYDDAEKIKREELLLKNVDVLFPCAGLFSINSNNVDLIKAKIIISGANCALDESCSDILYKKNIIYVPGFVANAGSLLKSYIMKEDFIVNRDYLERKIIKLFSERVTNLIKKASSNKAFLFREAQTIAKENIEELRRYKDTFQRKLKRKIIHIIRKLR